MRLMITAELEAPTMTTDEVQQALEAPAPGTAAGRLEDLLATFGIPANVQALELEADDEPSGLRMPDR
jgi:hypothetical protein